MDFEDRVSIVTGAGSGLGKLVVRAQAKSGARVVALGRDYTSVKRVAIEAGNNVLPIEADVTSEEAVSRAFLKIRDYYGRLDMCVNCAGVATPGSIVRNGSAMPLKQFRQVVDVNLIGLFDVMRLSAELMLENDFGPSEERGVIINVSSAASWQGQAGQSAYAASKAAVIGLMLPAAKDLAQYGIRVVTIAPGAFDTGMLSGLPGAVAQQVMRSVLYPRRLGRPEEFAELVDLIVRNQYFNATTISLDAGVRLA